MMELMDPSPIDLKSFIVLKSMDVGWTDWTRFPVVPTGNIIFNNIGENK